MRQVESSVVVIVMVEMAEQDEVGRPAVDASERSWTVRGLHVPHSVRDWRTSGARLHIPANDDQAVAVIVCV